MSIKLFWSCLFSPKLYKVYSGRTSEATYMANSMESWGNQIINSLCIMGNIALYTSPVLTYFLSKKGYFVLEELVTLYKFGIGMLVVVVTSYCLRSYGRLNSPVYLEFLKVLEQAKQNVNPDAKKALNQYDFHFKAWPVDFSWRDVEGEGDKGKRQNQASKIDRDFRYGPSAILSYVAAHTFAIRLIYPGVLTLLTFMLKPVLFSGRMNLVQKKGGQRFKLKTRDDNEIDSMFVDRRQNGGNGKTLVICSEGNAGFYEIGIMVTPLKCNYSVLGWNHPGFAESTGIPYPDQEQNAVDIVVQFAIHKLGFLPQDIILYGWSIGGYSTSWAAMTYPDVKAVMIDASFDDLLPLAIPRMPQFLEPLVWRVVRHHVNLEVATQLCQYPGPIRLFRRSEDEVICLVPGVLSTNRGNFLLSQLLRYRFPNLFCKESENALNEWLEETGIHQSSVLKKYDVNVDSCQSILSANIGRDEVSSYPSSFGASMNETQKCQLLLYLASTHLHDFPSTHCTPLPAAMFIVPQ